MKEPKSPRLNTFFRFSIFAVVIVGFFFFLNYQKGKTPKVLGQVKPKITKPVDPNITQDSTAIFSDENALYSYVAKFGPKQTTIHLNELSAQFGSCHDTAHKAGRISYELYNEKAFQLCSSECHSGCYHGATEAYFREHGTANLSESLKTLCSSELNPFFSHQCLHGIGHGLMAWANYELTDALQACELLPKGVDSCYSGVFMENIVGGLTDKKSDHFTKYLSDDPQYPCDAVDDKYKNTCYFLQTSRMMQLFSSDFKKIADGCNGAPAPYQRTCFESMGRDVGGVYPGKELSSIAACANAPAGTMRIGCLIGAAQDAFWDPTGQDAAIRFCKALTDPAEKSACYTVMFDRAPQVLASKDEIRTFCAKAEDAYKTQCQSYIN